MANIEDISNAELLDDLKASYIDIVLCEFAMAMGVVEVKGVTLQYRRDTNKKMTTLISNELARRGHAAVVNVPFPIKPFEDEKG